MGYPYLYGRYGGTPPARAGASHPTIAPYGPVGTAGGQVINVGPQNEREWMAFCRTVLLMPELADDVRFAARVERRAELDALVARVFGELTAGEAERRLTDAGIAYARQRTMAEFAEHPQLAARGRWQHVDTPAGQVEMPLPPLVREPDGTPRRVPAVGEHTADILTWLGRTPPG